MLTPDFPPLMARHLAWQNAALIASADTLDDATRWADRGAFFGSIAQTLNHILWDDRVWLARLRGDTTRALEIGAEHPYTQAPRDWAVYKRERIALDAEIRDWCEAMTADDMARSIRWTRGEEEVETSFGFNLLHMMLHGTHHRGQVHAMLTAAGAPVTSTDLQMLPD